MYKKIKSVRSLYETIRSTPGLKWLDEHYIGRPLQEYERLREEIGFERFVFWTVMVCLGTGSGISLRAGLEGMKGHLAHVVPSVHILLSSLQLLNVLFLHRIWMKLEEGWIRSSWTTQNFVTDLDSILNFGWGNVAAEFSAPIHIKHLSSHGAELVGAVPQHVKAALEEALIRLVKDFTRPSHPGELRSVSKRDVNALFDLLKRFNIFYDETPQRFYKEAEKRLVEEKKCHRRENMLARQS